MNGKKKGSHYLWLRSKPQQSQSTFNQMSEFQDLKRQVKKIQIRTRMENRVERRQKRTKTNQSKFSHIRPKTTLNHQRKLQKSLNFKQIQSIYSKEKQKTRQALTDFQIQKQQKIASGLLGQYYRYEQLSKRELIQKLISLEHLANTIFKKNKFLEEQLAKIKAKNQ